MDMERLTDIGKACGFSCVAPLDIHTIELREDVRKMCASNACGMYGHCWSCPPACGTLEECRARLRECSGGVLVQTVRELEDEFDGEGMLAAEEAHKANFERMHARLREIYADVVALGSGACTKCKKCTYPDAPCRFPKRMTSSMEAYGMLVQQICRENNMKYYYGRNHIAYTGCFLLK